jgi:hypothetical protein
MVMRFSILFAFSRVRRGLTGMLLDITVTFLDLLGGAFLGFALQLIRFLTAFTFFTHLEAPLSGCLGI